MHSEKSVAKIGESLLLFDTTQQLLATPSIRRSRPEHLDNGAHVKIGATPVRMFERSSPKRVRKAVLFTSLKTGDIPIENVFRDAPLVTQEMERVMDRLMTGGTGWCRDAE